MGGPLLICKIKSLDVISFSFPLTYFSFFSTWNHFSNCKSLQNKVNEHPGNSDLTTTSTRSPYTLPTGSFSSPVWHRGPINLPCSSSFICWPSPHTHTHTPTPGAAGQKSRLSWNKHVILSHIFCPFCPLPPTSR